MIRRLFKLGGALIIGTSLMLAGFALFTARMAVFPWWYQASAVGVELPPCNSYQSRVYVYCQDPRKSLGLDFTDFESEKNVDGKLVRVSGWWVFPAGPRALAEAQARGIVILVHGGGADRRAMLKHAKYLSAAGFHTLLIDCHNHGLNHSDGKGISFGLWESQSVIAAAEWAATHIRKLSPAGAVLPLPIAAFGTSQGGFAALLAASKSDLIRAVVAENSYVSVRKLLIEFPALIWFPKIVKEAALPLVSAWLGQSVYQLDVREFAENLGLRPVLLIHGEDDVVTTIENSEQILAALTGPKELWRVPKGEHEFLVNTMKETYEKKVVDFLSGRFAIGAAR